MTPLPPQLERLFCSEHCKDTAKLVRFWRRAELDGRIGQADVQDALRGKLAHWVSGGYPEQARHLPAGVRNEVWNRERGCCRECGEPGQEIDHIQGDSAELSNLQLLCRVCHHRKTALRMVPASVDSQLTIGTLERERVRPDEPARLCDSDQWQVDWRQKQHDRRTRLLGKLAGLGYTRNNFSGLSWSEMWDKVLEL